MLYLCIEKDEKEEKANKVERFVKALGDLKYIGYISESGRGTYIFKRNYFGKNKPDEDEEAKNMS